MDSIPIGLAAVVVLVLANGFFVATEFAIVAVRRSRLEQLLAEGHPTAIAAKQVVSRLDTYIAACQLGITMSSLALGWVGEPALAHLIESPLQPLVHQFAPTAAHGVAIALSFALITALHIVVGELAPKGLALQRPEGTALWVARPIQLFEIVFRWPIALLNGVGNGVLRIAGLQPASGHELVHSVEELRLLVVGSQEAGVVEESEARIASHALQFGEIAVGALMTPRTEIEAVPLTISRDELLARAASTSHSRLPVYRNSLDDIVGVLHLRDLFRVMDCPPGAFDLGALLRPALAVPASKHADDLLDEMRAGGRQLAVVIDEYGGTAGIVTLQDLVAALVGRIEVEWRAEDEDRPDAVPRFAPDGSMMLDGLIRLEEFEELTSLRLDESVHEQVETLGGLVMASLGRIPEVDDEVEVAERILRVEALDGRRVAVVRLLPVRSPIVSEAVT